MPPRSIRRPSAGGSGRPAPATARTSSPPNAVISAVGVLNRPKIPPLPGLDSFRGPLFHSAQWPEDVDLTGKRVALVGAGASAMQIGPAIADRVGSLTVFQRSPQWIAPNDVYFSPVGDEVHWLMEHVPYYAAWYRARLSWIYNDKVHPTLQIDPEWPEEKASINAANHGHRRFYERYLTAQLEGRPDLIAKSLPDYPPFGKRMLLDNGWYAMLRRTNVELVTEAVTEITETGLVDSAGPSARVRRDHHGHGLPHRPLPVSDGRHRPLRADDARGVGRARRHRLPGHHRAGLPEPVHHDRARTPGSGTAAASSRSSSTRSAT